MTNYKARLFHAFDLSTLTSYERGIQASFFLVFVLEMFRRVQVMNKDSKPGDNGSGVNQPMTPEEVDPKQKLEQKQELDKEYLASNPGDRIDPNMSVEEKAKQVAVDAPDITGDHITVPEYFVFETPPDGEKVALHHVKDAEEISDMIREARVDEDGNRTWR
jgi:hypothetical protein